VSTPKLLGIEIIIQDISAALALLVDALGLELAERFTSIDPAGQMAVLSVGDVAITLFEPASSGPGFVLPTREPRLSQIILGVAAGELVSAGERLSAAGIASQHADESRFFVPPATVAGALGVQTAIVLTDPAAAIASRQPD